MGEKADLLEHVYHKGMTGGVFFIILFIVGIISMALGLIKGHRRGALSIGFLSLDLSLTMFAQNELSQIVFFSPLILSYIWAFGYFLVPAFMAWVVYEWFDHKISKPVLVILCVSFGSMICAFVLSGITDLLFIEFYPSIDVLFIVSMLALLIVRWGIRAAKKRTFLCRRWRHASRVIPEHDSKMRSWLCARNWPRIPARRSWPASGRW